MADTTEKPEETLSEDGLEKEPPAPEELTGDTNVAPTPEPTESTDSASQPEPTGTPEKEEALPTSDTNTTASEAGTKGARFSFLSKAKMKVKMPTVKLPEFSSERVRTLSAAASEQLNSSGTWLKTTANDTSHMFAEAVDFNKIQQSASAATQAASSKLTQAGTYTSNAASSAYNRLRRGSNADTSATSAQGEDVKGVFGVALQGLVDRESRMSPVPYVVMVCVHTVAAAGLQTEGIFRSGSSDDVQARLIEHFDEDSAALLPEDVGVLDVAAVLKRYLRDLPEPLLTFNLYEKAVEAGSRDPALIREHISSLPSPNFATLRMIVSLLAAVASNSPLNRMNAANLGMVFGPVLLWPKPVTRAPQGWSLSGQPTGGAGEGAGSGDGSGEPDMSDVTAAMERASRDAPYIAAVITHLIESFDAIFNIENMIENEQSTLRSAA